MALHVYRFRRELPQELVRLNTFLPGGGAAINAHGGGDTFDVQVDDTKLADLSQVLAREGYVLIDTDPTLPIEDTVAVTGAPRYAQLSTNVPMAPYSGTTFIDLFAAFAKLQPPVDGDYKVELSVECLTSTSSNEAQIGLALNGLTPLLPNTARKTAFPSSSSSMTLATWTGVPLLASDQVWAVGRKFSGSGSITFGNRLLSVQRITI